jgi:hypothetical protein
MSVWGRIFAAGYDRIMAGAEKATLRAHREALIPHATGRVLEIGGGTGANLPFYEGVETLTLTEPERPMVRLLQRRLTEHPSEATVLRAPSRAGACCSSSTFAPTMSALRAGRTGSTPCRRGSATAATATVQRCRRSQQPASKSPNWRATCCVRRRRSCGHSWSASRRRTVGRRKPKKMGQTPHDGGRARP